MDKKILIIGDGCMDRFVYCDASRLAPDIPVPVLNIINEIENPGMAKNVYRNLVSLGVKCDIITNSNWYNITKTRYVHEKSNHTFFRVDSRHDIDRIDINNIGFDYDLIAISDYNKGFLGEDDIDFICKNHTNVFIDTKKIFGDWIKNVKYIKINNHEYDINLKYIDSNPDVKDKIIKTSGELGSFFRNERYPVDISDVRDSSGAGDTFFAGLVCEYLKTNDIISSIKFANLCASKVVKYRGVSVI